MPPILVRQEIPVEEALRQLPSGKRLAEETVASYFEACESARSQSKRAVGIDGITWKEATENARRVWALLSQARVFAFDPMQYAKFYHLADVHTCELAGFGWNEVTTSTEEARHLYSVYRDTAEKIPFPEKIPFDAVFIGFGKHLALSALQASMRITDETIRGMGVRSAQLYGFVLGTMGDVKEAYAVVKMEGRAVNGVGFVVTYTNDRSIPGYGRDDWPCDWLQPANLDPWVIPLMVEAINEKKHLTLEHPGLGVKMSRKAIMKRSTAGMLPLPMPYYVVTLKDSFAEEAVRKLAGPGRSLTYSHRFDVRGHDCVRVAKGKLPLDREIGAKLRKRGYVIYDIQPIAQEHFEILQKRGIRREPDEWIAVLVYHREAYIKGPEGAPYIPATRVLI